MFALMPSTRRLMPTLLDRSRVSPTSAASLFAVMLPARMRSADRKPVISMSAVNPSPVPKVRQSHAPSSVRAEAIINPSPHSFMALVPLTLSRIRLPSASVYQLDTLEDSRVLRTSIMPSRFCAGIEPSEPMAFARS